MRGARFLAVLLLLVGASSASAGEGDDDPGPPADPRCRVAAKSAAESHGIHISTKCNFAQIAIQVRTRRLIFGFRPTPSLSGPTDPGDSFRCGPFAEKPDRAARCAGRAGSGVRVGSYLVMRNVDCSISSTVEVTGVADCAEDVACTELAYVVTRRLDGVTGCGPG